MSARLRPELPLADAAVTLPRAWHTRKGGARPLTLYLAAVLAVALATGATAYLWPLMKPTATPLFFAAVMVSAWAGGLGPGLLATTLSALSMEYFFMMSLYSAGRWYEDIIRVEVFVLVALLISALNAARRRAEDILADSQLFLQSTLDSLSAQIALIDGGGTIVAANAAWQRFFDAPGGQSERRAAVGASYVDIWRFGVDATEVAAIGDGIRAVLAKQCHEFRGEYAWRAAAEPHWFVIHVTRFEGEGPVRAVVAHEDITERKRAEEAERRAEALRSVTRLASAAAHEINNPLAIIMGNVEIIAQQAPHDTQARIRPTLDAIERIRLIVQRMTRITDLKLYEQSPSLPEMLDLRTSSTPAEVLKAES